MSSQVGTLLSGRYRLDAQIGSGGMSMVYRAFDTVLERQVAIKLMHREIAADADQLERFRREARAVAQLNHPHVVGVIDAGEAPPPDEPAGLGEPAAMPYIVFEYVEGETLKDRIRRAGRLPIPEAVAYAIEIARALQAAHERRIVHRDVKPQNVLIDAEGTAKVTDFGIARSLTEEGLTADGRVLGTTDYVSPEQALGHDVGPQSDLYSLGIVLFEMLTGDVPFHGDNQVAVAMKHVREDLPDVQMLRPQVSSALAAVVDSATAKDLDRRYQEDAELIADLEDVLEIETARSGQATGEATAVLRTLPQRSRRGLALRLHPARILAVLALAGTVAAVAAVLLFVTAAKDQRIERGTGTRNVKSPPGLRAVSLGQSRAKDFDPFGGDGEHPAEAKAVVDQDTKSTWSTEQYEGGVINNKPGVGIWVDAKPSVAARAIDVISPTRDWHGAIYAAPNGPTPTKLDDFSRLASLDQSKSRTRVKINSAGKRYRYYLVWITKLPPATSSVQIAEIRLFRLSSS
jgi:eukaryotic-like serine/threonine-protein kinase